MSIEITAAVISSIATLIAAFVGQASLDSKLYKSIVALCLIASVAFLIILIPTDKWLIWESDFQKKISTCTNNTCKRLAIKESIETMPLGGCPRTNV